MTNAYIILSVAMFMSCSALFANCSANHVYDSCAAARSQFDCHCSVQMYHASAASAAWYVYYGALFCFNWQQLNIKDKFYIAGTGNVGHNYLPIHKTGADTMKYFMSDVNVTMVGVSDWEYADINWDDLCLLRGRGMATVSGGPWSFKHNATNLVIVNCNTEPATIYYTTDRSRMLLWPIGDKKI